jgi:transposase
MSAMNPLFPRPVLPAVPTLEEAAALKPEQIVAVFHSWQQLESGLHDRIAGLQRQLDWFKRQIFGQKSEKRLVEAPGQMSLGEALIVPQTGTPPAPPERSVAAHTRRTAAKSTDAGESLPFFDENRVPVEVIELADPATAHLAPEQVEVIGRKETYHLAQRPGSYVVLKYVRPVVKVKETQAISCPPAPLGVIEGSRADVSFLAGLLIDKLLYHLPFYRIHQRLADAGFKLSRPWLTQLAQQAASLLEPIYEAQLASVRRSRVVAMDETPIKAGRVGPGKMKQGYFWPIYGEEHEICFPYRESRRSEHVREILGVTPPPGAVLLTDGYGAYARHAEQTGLTHAQCWAHTRRGFFEAQAIEPAAAAEALEQIGALYAVEAAIREKHLTGDKKRAYRLEHAQPLVESFFAWVDRKLQNSGLLPKNPLTAALAYARERKEGLTVFLADPDVPIDTNHLERALRAIPMGRKSWLFCWTELGAKHVGIVQSLLATCRLHDIDPYEYLVDVLQRVGTHAAAQVEQLTPRLWKQHFRANPLRSALSPACPPLQAAMAR